MTKDVHAIRDLTPLRRVAGRMDTWLSSTAQH
jgi:hypothetical protein